MPNIDEIYKQLTGVNIEEQRKLWDERGKGYYGEYLVFEEIYHCVPGVCKVLMNVQIPTQTGRTTEIDLLMIHETGIYVFEIKHYKGTIYGKSDDENWTQYFRTTANNYFRNPIKQNQYHINALNKKLPTAPIFSYIVFTNPECNLKIENNAKNVKVCTLNRLNSLLNGEYSRREKVFSMEDIDGVFKELEDFAPIYNVNDESNSSVVSFEHYAGQLKNSYINRLKKVETEYIAKERNTNKIRVSAILIALAVMIASIAIAYREVREEKRKYESYANEMKQELDTFAQKFEKVEFLNNGDLIVKEDLVSVHNISLEKSNDIENAVCFTFELKWNGTDYGIRITDASRIIVMLKNGTIQEYNIYSKVFSSYSSNKQMGPGYNSKKIDFPIYQLFDIAIEDISYIKMNNIALWNPQIDYYSSILTGMELKLYEAPKDN